MAEPDGQRIRPRRPTPCSLRALSEEFELKTFGAVDSVFVQGVSLNSRDIAQGDLFVAMPGEHHHGSAFAEAALEAGASAILTDAQGAEHIQSLRQAVPTLVSSVHPRSILGSISSRIYNTQMLNTKIFGITGTNGKTSVVYLLEALMSAVGMRTGISTTAERKIGETVITSDLTTPEASEMHGLLARMQEERIGGVAIEVSAQAVVRNRIDGIMFDVVAFNNFSQDHLDEFGDMERYFDSKLRLFAAARARRGVVVVDGPHGRRIARQSEIPVTTLATEFGHAADWHLAVTSQHIGGVSFVLQGPDGVYFRGSVPLFGRFMAENAALALIMLHESGIPIDTISRSLDRGEIAVTIPGRLEEMTSADHGPKFFVDYGHTPGSFESMLDALGEVVTGRIIFMFGADGNRDTTKREAMGRIAATGADVVIVCDYHPRWEDPASIRAQLLAGAKSARSDAELYEIADQRTAIRKAISLARDGDVILYAGPGHEDYQEIAGEKIPYSARDEVRGALREAGLRE